MVPDRLLYATIFKKVLDIIQNTTFEICHLKLKTNSKALEDSIANVMELQVLQIFGHLRPQLTQLVFTMRGYHNKGKQNLIRSLTEPLIM